MAESVIPSVAAVPPVTDLIEVVDPDTGAVNKLTREQVVSQLNTYRGKAKEFDAAAREKADLAKELESLKPVADKYGQLKTYVSRLRGVDKTGTPDDEAMVGFLSATIDDPIERQAAIDEYNAAKLRAAGTQPEAGKGTAPAIPPQLEQYLLAQQKQIAELTAALKATSEKVSSTAKWHETTDAQMASNAIKKFLIDNDPVLGTLISDPKGAVILQDVTKQVMANRKLGEAVTPQSVEQAAQKWRDVLTAVDNKFPKTQVADPSLFGVTPSASPTTRFAGDGKMPNYAEYKQAGKSDQFYTDLAAWHNMQAGLRAASAP